MKKIKSSLLTGFELKSGSVESNKSEGFNKHRVERMLRGAGFWGEKKNNDRVLWIGYSHPVTYSNELFEKDVNFGVENQRVWLEGVNLRKLRQIAIEIVESRKLGNYENSRGIEVVGGRVSSKKSKRERGEERKGKKKGVRGGLRKGLRE